MLKQPINQVRLTNVAVVRLKKHGQRFEVACYKNKILNWRSGTELDVAEVLQTESIFQNVSKGQLAKVESLQKSFGTKDSTVIAKIILENGELQVSELERGACTEATFKDICSFVSARVFNRKTGFSVSIDMSAKRQSLSAIDLLLKSLPNEICRAQMLLNVTTQANQATELKDVLSNCKAMIRSEHTDLHDNSTSTDDTSLSRYTLSFLCSPPFYRSIDHFVTVKLCPPGSIQIVSSAENVVNVNEVTPILEEHSAEQEIGISLPNIPATPAAVEVAVLASSANGPKMIMCKSCEKLFQIGPRYREHCRSKWHGFNVKRKFKQLAVVAEDEYEELALDIREGLLAVDY